MGCRKHQVALYGALLVGAIYIAPHLFFMASLGEAYRGIPMMRTSNEDFYLARVQEILDGHPGVGSPAFWEYKEGPPLSPPVGEFLYALPSLIFGISPTSTLLSSRFFLPALLFFLVYLLVRRLNEDEDTFASTLSAIAGGLLVTLGYDLVDYRAVWSFLNQTASPVHFLVWSRPINPVLGAILLFSFFLSLTSLVQGSPYRKWTIASASACFALMIGSYFFSWGIALSVITFLALTYLFLRKYRIVGDLSLIVLFTAILSSPYWYATWRAAQSPWYEASVFRNGLFYTHYPLLNKFLLAALLVFLLLALLEFLQKRRIGMPWGIKTWHTFSLAFLLGGLWVYSQQMVTGRTVWPYHFVQYTIPLSMVVITVSLFHTRKFLFYGWHTFVSAALLGSLLFAILLQGSVYEQSLSYYTRLQSKASLFDFLNRRERDCVVLVADRAAESYTLHGLIPAFTHCNTYNSNWGYSLMPDERIQHNYLVYLLMRGVTAEGVEAYVHNNEGDARGYLFSNWKGLYGIRDFPDFSDTVTEERLAKIPEIYRAFLEKDITQELRKYRLDYLLFEGKPTAELLQRLDISSSAPIFEEGGVFVYAFSRSSP
ncbi:MAG: hypothetical protein A2849_01145 [Candidatus Taylorbacteria bacterium RIFCSPHIGHO2_01_FULL_51_15]|uniref:Glycosyltransferase RgtA/B/C/D-like domain-containing protein n=1 Tax=Candidatus Taylorbacteria bacterium RIFCSPHIGHO2_01_FULL_51_15 TaxID=1802304 RepID=A0A1G2M8Y0_9BACT|nr:MAG: hypothetical protein A2849_01145 [Candidatus Taylorbacteria bacterium RIFCSPHIGHO2_01_FULL_51_15]